MKVQVSQAEMNALLVGVEFGVQRTEKGDNLQAALAKIFDYYEVKKPEVAALAN